MNEKLSSQLSTLEGTGLIRVAAREPELEYTFRHVLSLEGAYESMLKQDRRRLHLDVGECLERALAGNIDEFMPTLARHFDEAGDDARAVDYLSRAAESASRRYANREAVALLDRALTVALRGGATGATIADVSTRAGRLREMDGNYDAALATYDALELLAKERGDIGMTCQAFLARAAVFCAPTSRFDAARGLNEANEALRLSIATGNRAGQAKAHWLILLVSKFNQDPLRGLESGEASAAIARELGLQEQLAYTLNDIYPVYLMTGSVHKGIAALEEAEQIWRELGNLPLLADTLANLGEMRAFGDGTTAAEPTLREAIRITDAIGNLWGQSYSRGVMALSLLEAGQYEEAVRLSELAASLGKQAGFVIAQIMMPCIQAQCLADLGQPQRGIELIRRAAGIAESLLPSWRGYPAAMMALCVMKLGDLTAVATAIEDARRLASNYDISALYEQIAEVEHAHLAGAHEEVIRKSDEAETIFAVFGCRLYTPVLWTRKAEAYAALGCFGDAEASAREALARSAVLGVRRGLWRTWSALWVALNAQGRESDAREAKEQAREEIAYTASRAGSDDLRFSFLNLPDVRTILEDR